MKKERRPAAPNVLRSHCRGARRNAGLYLALIGLASGPNCAHAASLVWTGTTNNNWDSVVTTPNAALFNLASPASVIVASNIDAGAITFTTGGWTLAAGGGVLTSGATGTLTVTTSSGIDTISANIADGATFGTGGGVTSLAKSGTGTLVLATASAYTGTTTVNAGTLQLAVDNGLAISSALTVASGASSSAAGTLDLNGHAQTVNSLSAATGTVLGVVTNNLSGSLSTLTVSGGTATFNGLLKDGAGTLGLHKISGGTLTLGGNETYTGATVIDGGTLGLSPGAKLSGTASIAVNSAGTLLIQPSVLTISGLPANAVILNGGTFAVASNTSAMDFFSPLSTGGSFAINTTYSAGASNLLDLSSMVGGSLIRLGTTSTGTLSSSLVIKPDASATLRFGAGLGSLTVSSILRDQGAIRTNVDITGASTTVLAAANLYTGTTIINGNVSLTNALGLGSGSGTDADATTINAGGTLTTTGVTIASEKIIMNGGTAKITTNGNVWMEGAGTLTGTFNGDIGGAGPISFSNTVALNSTYSFTGTATIASNGVVTVGASANLGNASAVINVLAGGQLTLNGPIQNAISTAGTTTFNYSPVGTVIQTGGNVVLGDTVRPVTGNYSLSNGTLQTGSGTATVTINPALTVSGNSTIYPSENLMLAGGITGSGALTLVGGSSISIQSAAPVIFSGTITSSGSVSLGDLNTAGTLTLWPTTITGNINHAGDVIIVSTFPGTTTFGGATTKITGTLLAQGSLTVNSNTTVGQFTLAGAYGNLLGNGSLTVSNSQLDVRQGTINFLGTFVGVEALSRPRPPW